MKSTRSQKRGMAVVKSDAASLARALCRNVAQPPSIVVLVGGLSRGFAKPERWRSLRRNVLESLGTPDTELLLYLKTFRDEGPPSPKWRPTSGISTSWAPDSEDSLMQVIAELKPTMVRFDRDAGVEARLRLQYNRTCVSRQGGAAEQAFLGEEGRPLQLSGIQVGYWHTMQRLWSMVRERERQRALNSTIARVASFDQVMFAPPDLIHFLSVGPYCMYRRETVYHSIGDDCGELFHRSTPRFSQICRQVCRVYARLAPRVYHVTRSATQLTRPPYLPGAHRSAGLTFGGWPHARTPNSPL